MTAFFSIFAASSWSSAKKCRASASRTTGQGRGRIAARKPAVSGWRPRPGPRATAPAPATKSRTAWASAVAKWFPAPMGMVMTSGKPALSAISTAPGQATLTNPEPARSAPRPAKSGAPVSPRLPPTTTTRPALPLWSSGSAGPKSPMTRGAIRPARQGWRCLIRLGMPMSRTSSLPTKGAAGAATSPVLAASKATVALARTAMGEGRPCRPSRPEGMSRAKMYARPASRLTASTTAAMSGRSSPRKPVPRSPSTMTSGASAPERSALARGIMGKPSRAASRTL